MLICSSGASTSTVHLFPSRERGERGEALSDPESWVSAAVSLSGMASVMRLPNLQCWVKIPLPVMCCLGLASEALATVLGAANPGWMV